MQGQYTAARLLPLCAVALIVVGLSGCSLRAPDRAQQRDGPGEHRDVSHVPDAVPRPEPRSRGGNPASYVVFGKRYHTLPDSSGFVERGIASWYGRKFHGRRTSNGEVYDMYSMSAAHKRLPIPTYLQVTNLENGRQVVVRVNDRGPFHDNRIVDLSYAAASRIGMLGKGTAMVEIRTIDPGAPAAPIRVAQSTTQAKPPQPGAPPRIYLQAGAFSSGSNAERLRLRLQQSLGHGVRIIPAAAHNGGVHRVQVGPLPSVEVADRVATQMHSLGVGEPLVVLD